MAARLSLIKVCSDQRTAYAILLLSRVVDVLHYFKNMTIYDRVSSFSRMHFSVVRVVVFRLSSSSVGLDVIGQTFFCCALCYHTHLIGRTIRSRH